MKNISEDAVPLHPGGTARKRTDMKYVFCPECGRQISKSGKGTVSELSCPKCGSELSIEVEGSGVHVYVMNESGTGEAENAPQRAKTKTAPRAAGA